MINDKGEKTEVVLPIELYERLLDEAEELEDIKDFDEAMKKGDKGAAGDGSEGRSSQRCVSSK